MDRFAGRRYGRASLNQRSFMSIAIDQSVRNCQECHTICIETIQYCLKQGGKHVDASHIRLLTDCAQICQTSADFMIRGSDLQGETCEACGNICGQCADECERFAKDVQMRRCSEACRRCAEACRQSLAVPA
jgi:hypothetical protein